MGSIKNIQKDLQRRSKNQSKFHTAMLTEAVDNFLSGDVDIAKAILKDYISATIGFKTFSEQIGRPVNTLQRMLSPAGNPRTSDFFEMLYLLQKNEGIRFTVTPLYDPNSEMILKCMVWFNYRFHLKN